VSRVIGPALVPTQAKERSQPVLQAPFGLGIRKPGVDRKASSLHSRDRRRTASRLPLRPKYWFVIENSSGGTSLRSTKTPHEDAREIHLDTGVQIVPN
jgi:hypothetical protein